MFGALLGAHGLLIKIFQSTFPRSSSEWGDVLSPDHPNFVVITIIPNIGYVITSLFVIVLVDWFITRKKVREYGLWLEATLQLVHKGSKNGYFKRITNPDISFVTTSITSLIIVFLSFYGWYSIDVSTSKKIESLLSKPVSIKEIGSVKIKTPQFKKEMADENDQ